MRPKILLSTSDNNKTQFYIEAVTKCGGEPFGGYLPPVSTDFDALLLCGGSDVHPNRYGEEINGSRNIDMARDAIEFELIERFMAQGKPIFGICRGHQVINIALGGALHQDIPEAMKHISIDGVMQMHHVVTDGESFLREIYGEDFPVNSSHHQAVSTLGNGLRAIAHSKDDGYCEAFTHESLPIFGVQWHPERMSFSMRREDTVDGRYMFEYFLNLCK